MRLLPPALRAFLVVARSGTVHAAARELGLTQTAVTRRVLSLEEELDVSLFLRSRRGMSLTDAGQALLVYCQHALALEGETLSQLTGNGTEAPVSLVVQGPSSIMRARLIPALCEALREHPRVNAEFRLNDVGTGVSALKSGEADLDVLRCSDVADEFASKKLRAERYVLVGPATWAGRELNEIVAAERIVDFDPKDDMTYEMLAKLGLRERAREGRHFVNNTDALAALVEAGHGYTVLSAEFAAPLIAAGRLAPLGGRRVMDFELALAWHPRRYLPKYFRDALRAVK